MDINASNAVILIVDDVLSNIQLLAIILQSYTIKVASNGKKALEIAGSDDPPDLILLDIMMPDMDGYEVCTRLKNNPHTQGIPVVFIAGMREAADETRGLELGAVDYVTNPFNSAIVKARVKNHLELKQHRDLQEQMVEARTAELKDDMRKRAEGEELRLGMQAQAMAREKLASLGELATGVVHEINQPLTYITQVVLEPASPLSTLRTEPASPLTLLSLSMSSQLHISHPSNSFGPLGFRYLQFFICFFEGR
ncbi:MAG: hypothetical protein A2521_08895 [Deltaproteobacteria bacterium RIFOXYD12_FULL_57_12]|nr:MAG: hypothetical protein A2521_08895 [Deltaproteobacteria bacterium RIFOXYD12_FULL_57_12]